MSNKKQNLIWSTSLLLLFVFTGCKDNSLKTTQKERTKQWVSILEKSSSPAKVIKDELLLGNSVLVSETPGYNENILFLQYLIPILYESGTKDIGVWFLDASQQSNIDTFLKGNGTMKEANKILSIGSPMANYKEYANLLILVAQFNKNLEPDEPMFRLIGLSEKGDLSLKGLNTLNKSSINNDEAKDITKSNESENPENPPVEIENSNNITFIWWKREGIASFKLGQQKSKLFFLHAPVNQTLTGTESAEKEAILFEKALLEISPYDYVKAVSLDSVKDLISDSVAWDWYILTSPASQFTIFNNKDGASKELPSSCESDLKKFKKEL